MGDLSFQPHVLSLSGMGFLTKNLLTEKVEYLFAVFFYIHHEHYLVDVNDKLAKRNLRPITRGELQNFFRSHRLSLTHTRHPHFISTHPGDILESDDGSETSLVPAIWKDSDGVLQFGNVILDKLAGGKEYIPDHQMFVIAIDESKSEIL